MLSPRKATRPGAPWGPGDKDQKGLQACSPKALKGPTENRGQGREPRGRARGPGKDGGLKAWMDELEGGREDDGLMDGWMEDG